MLHALFSCMVQPAIKRKVLINKPKIDYFINWSFVLVIMKTPVLQQNPLFLLHQGCFEVVSPQKRLAPDNFFIWVSTNLYEILIIEYNAQD